MGASGSSTDKSRACVSQSSRVSQATGRTPSSIGVQKGLHSLARHRRAEYLALRRWTGRLPQTRQTRPGLLLSRGAGPNRPTPTSSTTTCSTAATTSPPGRSRNCSHRRFARGSGQFARGPCPNGCTLPSCAVTGPCLARCRERPVLMRRRIRKEGGSGMRPGHATGSVASAQLAQYRRCIVLNNVAPQWFWAALLAP